MWFERVKFFLRYLENESSKSLKLLAACSCQYWKLLSPSESSGAFSSFYQSPKSGLFSPLSHHMSPCIGTVIHSGRVVQLQVVFFRWERYFVLEILSQGPFSPSHSLGTSFSQLKVKSCQGLAR